MSRQIIFTCDYCKNPFNRPISPAIVEVCGKQVGVSIKPLSSTDDICPACAELALKAALEKGYDN